ncbi:MAG: diguanylate cyclase [Candidatus Omnitrophica bacterium]|nr:diguanylate cyclase [Candidatus Omnitrophota bacterium]MBU4473560.1 diguanylate cyclase [Candidatus Omnitrophota bacterium]MCG2706277.1 diguanylate cyclase [Candidatus Omnitrophota bacterium]
MPKDKNISLAAQGLKYKLKVSFYLMSILPLLVCIYLVANYILPYLGFQLDIVLSILISIFISIIGFLLIKEVFDRILSVSNEAKLIAAGDINRKLEITPADEVSELADSLNKLTQGIRSNMNELKSYNERTNEINLKIQRHVLTLSGLLQISSLISQDAKLEDILQLILEKSKFLADSDLSYLLYIEEGNEAFYMKAADGINSERVLKIKIERKESIFNKFLQTSGPVILDNENMLPENLNADFRKKFNLKNTLALPIFLRRKIIGILGIGNSRELFSYKKADIELLDILAKQLAIAEENDRLLHRLEKLEIKDGLTGLYNEVFIRNRLQEEIKRAIVSQRPCAFILLGIDNFGGFRNKFGSLQAENALKKIAYSIRDSVTEIDRVARIADDEFAVVLPEKNKRKAQKIANDIRKKIEYAFSSEQEADRKLTASGGVSENPLDGIEAEELISKAKELLSLAKKEGKNRIVI